jgi:hypothetical protein
VVHVQRMVQTQELRELLRYIGMVPS